MKEEKKKGSVWDRLWGSASHVIFINNKNKNNNNNNNNNDNDNNNRVMHYPHAHAPVDTPVHEVRM